MHIGDGAEWLERAKNEVICDCGQLSPQTRRFLERAAKNGVVAKWRGYWYPVPGESYGLGPLKTCFGPLEFQKSSPGT